MLAKPKSRPVVGAVTGAASRYSIKRRSGDAPARVLARFVSLTRGEKYARCADVVATQGKLRARAQLALQETACLSRHKSNRCYWRNPGHRYC